MTVAQGCSLSTVIGDVTRVTARFLRGWSTSMMGSESRSYAKTPADT